MTQVVLVQPESTLALEEHQVLVECTSMIGSTSFTTLVNKL